MLSLATAQRVLGHDLTVVTDQISYFSEACAGQGIPTVIETGLDAREGNRAATEKRVETLIRRITEHSADLIHAHASPAAALAIPASHKLGIPCVFTHHMATGIPRNASVAKVLELPFSTICVCQAGFTILAEHGLPQTDLYYIPNGTRPALPGMRTVHGPYPGLPDLLLAGHLERVKGVDIAILAMAGLRRMRGQNCPVLNIYGTGSEQRYLEDMVTILALDDVVRFHGVVPGILDRCPSTDVLIVPSRSESGPVVVLEAMSHGMPVVAFDVGEVSRMLPDERYGRVVPANSITAFSEAIDAMLADVSNGRFEPSLSMTRHREHYTNEIMAKRTDEVYDRVLQKFQKGRGSAVIRSR